MLWLYTAASEGLDPVLADRVGSALATTLLCWLMSGNSWDLPQPARIRGNALLVVIEVHEHVATLSFHDHAA